MDNKYNITWKGPILFSEFTKENENKDSFKDLMKNGLYLFCLERQDGSYAVTYVGAAPTDTIFKRINEWYKDTKSGKLEMYIDFNLADMKNEKLDVLLSDIEDIKDVIEKNITGFWVFYAEPNLKDEFIRNVDKPIEKLEGALKKILRKKMLSRKYLTVLEYPMHGLDYNKIANLVEGNYKVIGFND